MSIISKTLSHGIISDIVEAYSIEDILEIIGLSSLDVALILNENITENLHKFDNLPLDAYNE
tara:strand:- start:1174 stop:1359 length:186 start_codon:yes stop_codon:yes gene_type:complete